MTLRDLIELADEWRTMRGIDLGDYVLIASDDEFGHESYLVSPMPSVSGHIVLRYSNAP